MNPELIVHSSFDLLSSKTSGTSTIFLMHYLLKEQTSELFSKEIHSQSPTCNRDLQFSYLLWIISLLEIALVTFNVTRVLCSALLPYFNILYCRSLLTNPINQTFQALLKMSGYRKQIRIVIL